jgi:hypothetical protein
MQNLARQFERTRQIATDRLIARAALAETDKKIRLNSIPATLLTKSNVRRSQGTIDSHACLWCRRVISGLLNGLLISDGRFAVRRRDLFLRFDRRFVATSCDAREQDSKNRDCAK